MTISKAGFRGLLTLSIVLAILAAFIAIGTESSLPESLQAYLEEQYSDDAIFADPLFITVLGLAAVLWLVSLVGLYLFRPFARPLMVIASIVGFSVFVLMGPTVESGVASAFNHLVTLIDGMILAIVYLPPVSAYFGRT